jgi:hypothetical protein
MLSSEADVAARVAFCLSEPDFCLGCSEVGISVPHNCTIPTSPYLQPSPPVMAHSSLPPDDEMFKRVFDMVNSDQPSTALVTYILTHKWHRFNHGLVKAYNLDPQQFVGFADTWNNIAKYVAGGETREGKAEGAIPWIVSLFRSTRFIECKQTSSVWDGEKFTCITGPRYATLSRTCRNCTCSFEEWRDRSCLCTCHGEKCNGSLSHPGVLVYRPVTFLSSHCLVPCYNRILRQIDGRKVTCGNSTYFTFREMVSTADGTVVVDDINIYEDHTWRSSVSSVPIGTKLVRVCSMWDCQNEIPVIVTKNVDVFNCPNCPSIRDCGIGSVLVPPPAVVNTTSTKRVPLFNVYSPLFLTDRYSLNACMVSWHWIRRMATENGFPTKAALRSISENMKATPCIPQLGNTTVGYLWELYRQQWTREDWWLVPFHVYTLVRFGYFAPYTRLMSHDDLRSMDIYLVNQWQSQERGHYRSLVRSALKFLTGSELNAMSFHRYLIEHDRPQFQVIDMIHDRRMSIPFVTQEQLLSCSIEQLCNVYGGRFKRPDIPIAAKPIYVPLQRKTLEFLECVKCGLQSNIHTDHHGEHEAPPTGPVDDMDGRISSTRIGEQGTRLHAAMKLFTDTQEEKRTKVVARGKEKTSIGQTRLLYSSAKARDKTINRIREQVVSFMARYTTWFQVDDVKQQRSVEWIRTFIIDLLKYWANYALPDNASGESICPVLLDGRVERIGAFLLVHMMQYQSSYPGFKEHIRVKHGIKSRSIVSMARREARMLHIPTPTTTTSEQQTPIVSIPPLVPAPRRDQMLQIERHRLSELVKCIGRKWADMRSILCQFHLGDATKWERDFVWQFGLLERIPSTRMHPLRTIACAVLCMLAFMHRYHDMTPLALYQTMEESKKIRVFDSSSKSDKAKELLINKLFKRWVEEKLPGVTYSQSSIASPPIKQCKQAIKDAILSGFGERVLLTPIYASTTPIFHPAQDDVDLLVSEVDELKV